MVKFSELEINSGLEGEKRTIAEVLNKPIVIVGALTKPSKYKTEFYTAIQFYYLEDATKTKYIVFTGSEVIRKNIERAKEYCESNNQPFEIETKVVQTGKCYTLV